MGNQVDFLGGRVDFSGGSVDFSGGRVDFLGNQVDFSGGRVNSSIDPHHALLVCPWMPLKSILKTPPAVSPVCPPAVCP